MSGFRRLITEAHRRSLWQVLGIYLGASWLALQVVDILAENAGLPSWFPGLALALLVLGLPIVLATAFVQEGSPGVAAGDAQPVGQPAAVAAPAAPTVASRLLTWRNAMIGGAAAFSLWGVIAAAWLVAGAAPTGLQRDDQARRSIAVLPFENLSGDADNAYFADGVHEEILTRLASIDALRVISRTSVMEYRGTDKNLRQIGQELGVAVVLEGSVRRSGDRVRITAQLIDASTDEHLWAQSYDRALSDIFAIQADVAQRIAEALHAQLQPADRRDLAERPTENMEAYELYLRALEMSNRGTRLDEIAAAQQLYERVVESDPDFVEARARLAWSHLLTYWLGFDRSPARVDVARAHIAHLQRIAPDAPATRYALGFLRYYGEYDFAGAAREFELALDGVPHLALPGLAYVHRRMGRWDEHIRLLQQAIHASPRDQDLPRNLAETYAFLGRVEEAEGAFRQAMDLSPTSADAYYQLARTLIAVGRLDDAQEVLADAGALSLYDPELQEQRFRLAYLRGDTGAALAALDDVQDDFIVGQLIYAPVALRRGLLYQARDASLARAAFSEAVRQLEPVAGARPWDPRVWLALAHAYSGAGRAGDAHEAMMRVRELYPVERDRLLGVDIMTEFAEIHARLGEQDDAIALLRRVRAGPSRLSPWLLAHDPVWESLRADPRFREISAEVPGG